MQPFKKKTYCYLDKCTVVRTGFHLENYPVCTICKQEITEDLADIIKNKQNKKNTATKKEEDDWEYL